MNKYCALILMLLIIPAATGLSLTNLSSQESGQFQQLSVAFDGLANSPRVFVAGQDLIVDFYGVANLAAKQQFSFASGLVREVALVAIDKQIRLLLVGGARYNYKVQLAANKLNLILSEQLANPLLAQNSSGFVNLNQARANSVNSIAGLKFSRDDNDGGIIEIAYSGDTRMEIKEQRIGNNLILKLNGVSFNPDLLKRIDATDFATPIKYITTTAENNGLQIIVENRNNWDYALYQLQGKLVINIRKLTKASNTSLANLNGNKSDRVSFNFQDIDIRALLQLLADFSAYNILVSDSVSGTMSLKLNNVPWEQALQIILNVKGLAMKHDGNVLLIAPSSELVALDRLQQDKQKSQEAIEPLDTLTLRLKYAQAAIIQAMIQQKSPASGTITANYSSPSTNSALSSGLLPSLGNSLLSARGTILVDSRTNTLIINDTPAHLSEIKDLVAKIDIPVKQVLIEARIVEANSNFEKDLGARLLLAGVGGSLTYANTLENGVSINQQGIYGVGNAPANYVNQNFGVNAGAAMSTVFAPNSNTLIGLEIDALELQSQGRTIASPKVMTVNYQAANIQQGVQIPYQQASSAGNTNIAFVNATLSLQVTPQITDDGYILLNVNIQKDTPSSTLEVQGTPAIDTNSVTTQIRVKDGSTILVGGIYIDNQQKVLQQIPGLGDIPYVGWLFKSQSTRNNKKELLIFITPRVIANSLENDN